MIQFKIRHIHEVTSTNTVALEEAKKNAEEGLVISTDYQTEGRGKPGNQWISPKAKNLLFSVLLRPPLTPAQAPLLTQLACRAVAKILREMYEIESEFKNPNDVMIGSKKICGTLVEAVSSGSKLDAVVVGIGLNVNATQKDLPPEGVSMTMMTGRTYNKVKLMAHILDEMGLKLQELYRTGTIKSV